MSKKRDELTASQRFMQQWQEKVAATQMKYLDLTHEQYAEMHAKKMELSHLLDDGREDTSRFVEWIKEKYGLSNGPYTIRLTPDRR